jgi:phospholipase C
MEAHVQLDESMGSPVKPSRAFLFVILAAAFGCTGHPGGGAPTLPAAPLQAASRVTNVGSNSHIKHVVILIQENRSFDNLFARFPGADGATYGYYLKKVGSQRVRTKIALKKQPLSHALDVNHNYTTFQTDYQSGNMDGFNLATIDGSNPAGTYPYQYVDPKDMQPYWVLAQQYVLADHLFQTQGSGSFTAHQDLIAGGTAIDQPAANALIDWPTATNWGCGASPSSTTPLVTKAGMLEASPGPYPCLNYPTGTLRDLLDRKHVSWKYYTPSYRLNTVGTLWDAFAAIKDVYNSSEWNVPPGSSASGVTFPETSIFSDITSCNLPAVSWLIPASQNSDHPWGPNGVDDGPSWVAQVITAIGQSGPSSCDYWASTAIVVVWDDWGGFYDHATPPPGGDFGGFGFRVPMLIVSPYVPAGKVSHTQYEFGSILKFVEQTFHLGSMGTSDARATSIGNVFTFKNAPRKFRPIPSSRSRAHFLHEPPSNMPVDTE